MLRSASIIIKASGYFIVGLFASIFNISCGKRIESKKHEIILARIGDKTISVNEFIRRLEYTVRPPYCSENINIHKKIVRPVYLMQLTLAKVLSSTIF